MYGAARSLIVPNQPTVSVTGEVGIPQDPGYTLSGWRDWLGDAGATVAQQLPAEPAPQEWWEGPLGQVSQSAADWVSEQMAPGTTSSGYTRSPTYEVPAAPQPAPMMAGATPALLAVGAGLLGARLLGII